MYSIYTDSLTLLLSAGFLGFSNGSDSCGRQPRLERRQPMELVGDPPFEPSEAELKDTQFTLGARIDGVSAGPASTQDLFAQLMRP